MPHKYLAACIISLTIVPAHARTAPAEVLAVPRPNASDFVDIVVRQGDTILWSGDLIVARNGQASFSQTKNQSIACGAEGTRSLMTGLTISIGRGQNNDLNNVSVEWTRPYRGEKMPSEVCNEEELGTLTARISARANFSQGKTATLQGDGGLVVTLARR